MKQVLCLGRQNEPNEGRALKEGLTNAIPETTCRYQKMGPCTYIYIQSVTGGTDQTSGECSLDQTIPI